MKLYIAEKPSMAREIAACLKNPKNGNGFIKTEGGVVTWLFGHVLRQVEPEAYDAKYKFWRAEDLPIVPQIWKLEVDPKAAEQFNIVKKLIKDADEIIHAGDPDREGQLLVDEVLDFVGNKKPVKRILLNALDETSIKRANENLRDNAEFFNLKQSALARARADWLIGMNLSRAYTLAARRLGHDEVFPIGRVKTPTLALVVRREKEITNFKPVDFFNIFVQFQHENGTFVAKWKPNSDDIKFFDSQGRLINKKFAEACLKKFATKPLDGKISSCKTSEKKESQPLPFSLSTLQIAAGKTFGYTPQQVLDAAQSLYEKKLTTYPRSDCEFLPTSQLSDAKKILANLQKTTDDSLKKLADNADAKIKSRAWNNSKISAHHAIIPTIKPVTGGLNIVELNIYKLIAKNYAVQFYPVHIFDETIIEVTYKKEKFSARGKIIKQIGWREFYVAAKTKADDEISQNLPQVAKGDTVTYKNSELKKSTTEPPPRFSASSLVQGMKDIHKYVKNPEVQQQLKDVYGIGTEATRAQIIDDLITRGFLKFMGGRSKKSLQPTEKAFLLIDLLPDEITFPDATAIWEDKLHSMSDGEGTLDEFLAGQVQFTKNLCKKAVTAKIKPPEGVTLCPRCKSGVMVKRKRKDGSGEFWSCSNYPNCKTTCEDKDGKPDLENLKSAVQSNIPCPRCKSGVMVKRKRKDGSGEFWGCSNYPNCRMACNDKNGKPDFEGGKF
ncbi:MAG: DNA topoisomerase 3 [Selenomonadaceae bacterium]|nr:DNA topoisomerase 3 [Selenomonadaceae bacterium]